MSCETWPHTRRVAQGRGAKGHCPWGTLQPRPGGRRASIWEKGERGNSAAEMQFNCKRDVKCLVLKLSLLLLEVWQQENVGLRPNSNSLSCPTRTVPAAKQRKMLFLQKGCWVCRHLSNMLFKTNTKPWFSMAFLQVWALSFCKSSNPRSLNLTWSQAPVTDDFGNSWHFIQMPRRGSEAYSMWEVK